jgi:hypothetical protein
LEVDHGLPVNFHALPVCVQQFRAVYAVIVLGTRLTFAIAANEDETLVRLLKNLNRLNKKYPIFDFDFDGFDSRVPAYRSPYSS